MKRSIHLRLLVSPMLVLLVCLGAVASEPNWSETGLRLENTTGNISDQRCRVTEQKFVACLQALQVLAQAGSKDRAFANSGLMMQFPKRYGKEIQSFESLKIVEVLVEKVQDNQSAVSQLAEMKKRRAAELVAFREFYFDSKLNLTEVRDYLTSFISKDKEAAVAADVINAYLGSEMDPHTRIDPTSYIREQMEAEVDSFVGIGASVHSLGDSFWLSPLDGSPALAAGVRHHDVLTHVDGEVIAGISLENVVKKIRGIEGTVVKLTIKRKSQAVVIPIVRGKIVTENVRSKILQSGERRLGYLKIEQFIHKTCATVKEKLGTLQNGNIKGLVLDLRGNPGGLLDQAICVGTLFVGSQPIVGVKDLEQNSELEFYSCDTMPSSVRKVCGATKTPYFGLPMLVLIDAGSASASEIVSGAIQDYGRGWILGQRSYGKGSVQELVELKDNPKITMRRTIQRFYQPSGRTNQVTGISPDIAVDPKPDATDEDRFALREEDLFTNALPSLGRTWTQPFPAEVAALERCVNKSGKARALYQSQLDSPLAPDYQLLVTQDVFSCAYPQSK